MTVLLMKFAFPGNLESRLRRISCGLVLPRLAMAKISLTTFLEEHLVWN